MSRDKALPHDTYVACYINVYRSYPRKKPIKEQLNRTFAFVMTIGGYHIPERQHKGVHITNKVPQFGILYLHSVNIRGIRKRL